MYVSSPMSAGSEFVRPLAELAVQLGANVQPGQIVSVVSEPGKEPLARAVAEAAYERGAKFVDLYVFDMYFKRARVLHADPETLGYVPPWLGAQVLALGEHRAASIALSGSVDPHLMDDLDPALVGKAMFPWLKEIPEVVEARTTNWTGIPCPTEDWAALVHPEIDPREALARLWREIAHICRIDEPDPVAAWRSRLDQLVDAAGKLDALALDGLRYEGPGTELTVGLFPSSRWRTTRFSTVDGIEHVANIPTEEIFTTPDPERVNGFVRATKPLFTAGAVISGLEVRFEDGHATAISAERGAATLQTLAVHDAGAARLGEVALVDRGSRIGAMDTVFFDTMIDENAASHIALGQGYGNAVGEDDQGRVNSSGIHIDFMIGSNELVVTGLTREGAEIPLLRDGAWQL
jgi:aminopeptidase